MHLRKLTRPEPDPTAPQRVAWGARDHRAQAIEAPSLAGLGGQSGVPAASQEITNFPPPIAGNADPEFLEWRLELL